MEYKKNRQTVITEEVTGIKKPESCQVPAFLRESQPQQRIVKSHKDISTQIQRLKKRTNKLLTNPSQNDPVYKVLQRLFKTDCSIHLNREREEEYSIRRLARKRFLLGYPPRKNNDTSIGDAINWEWIVHCAKQTGHDVVIVSRDKDYGFITGNEGFLNDWLRQEFKERVSAKRKIHLTPRLTDGFALAKIHVTKKEREDEDKLEEVLRLLAPDDRKKLEEILS